jgi:hypothetical protein
MGDIFQPNKLSGSRSHLSMVYLFSRYAKLGILLQVDCDMVPSFRKAHLRFKERRWMMMPEIYTRLRLSLALLAAITISVNSLGWAAASHNKPLTAGNPSTKSGNTVWQVASFPLRLVTGTSSGALGLLGGGMKGIVTTEEKFAANTFGKVDENPIMVVPGLLGTVVAVPVGFLIGAPEGFVKGAKAGYTWWDNF